MTTPRPIAPCPACGTPQTVRLVDGVWRTVQHSAPRAQYALCDRRCGGGTVTLDVVVAAVRARRTRAEAHIADLATLRTRALAEYRARVAQYDTDEARDRDAIAEEDRLLARLETGGSL